METLLDRLRIDLVHQEDICNGTIAVRGCMERNVHNPVCHNKNNFKIALDIAVINQFVCLLICPSVIKHFDAIKLSVCSFLYIRQQLLKYNVQYSEHHMNNIVFL